MHKPVFWSPLSENDFDNILSYISHFWGSNVALNFIELTEHFINQISHNPKQFPIFEKRKRIRRCVMTKHNSLFYREFKGRIEILRIFDTRQDPNTLTF